MEQIKIYSTYIIILLLPILSIILSRKLILLKTYFSIKLSIIILCFYVIEFFDFRIINVLFNTSLLMFSYIVVLAIVINLIFRRFNKKTRKIIGSIVLSFYYLITLLPFITMIWLLGDLYSEVKNIRIDSRYIIGAYNTGNFAHSNVECELIRKYSFGVIYRIVDSHTFYGEYVTNFEKIKVKDVSDKKIKVEISIGRETKVLKDD